MKTKNIFFWVLGAFLWLSIIAFCPVKDKRLVGDGGKGPNVISGRVSDMDGVRKGIHVRVKKHWIGTLTDENGYFLFTEVPSSDFVIEFSFKHQKAEYRMKNIGYGKNIYLENIVIHGLEVQVERILSDTID